MSMNVWQATQQIISALNPVNLKWPDAPAEPVLGKVAVVAPSPDFFTQAGVAPFAWLHNESQRDHEEHPGDLVEEARWTLWLFATNATSQGGGAAVAGGNRLSLGSSRGRGLLEVEPLVLAQLRSALVGLSVRPRSTGAQSVVPQELRGLVAGRGIDIVATRLPCQPAFPTPRQLLATSPGSGLVSLTWAAAPARYDLIGATVVYKAGATAPTSPTDGTAVFVAGTPTGLASIATGVGQKSLSVFWAFDATRDPWSAKGAATPNRWSGSQLAGAAFTYRPVSATIVA